MDHEVAERRGSTCVSPGNGTVVALHVSVPVRLLGLSSAGLLLACEVPLRAGSTVRVVSGRAGRRLEAELCVDEVSNRPDDGIGGYLLCGRAPSFDTTDWRTITAPLVASVPCGSRALPHEDSSGGGIRRRADDRPPGPGPSHAHLVPSTAAPRCAPATRPTAAPRMTQAASRASGLLDSIGAGQARNRPDQRVVARIAR